MRALRSFLYVPAHRSDLITKAFASRADAVIVDFEDGTPADAKEAARISVPSLVRGIPNATSRLWLRIDSCDALDVDLEVAEAVTPVGVFIAKATTETTRVVTERLARATLIVPLLESAAALSEAREIADISGVHTLAIGLVDLMADLRVSADAPSEVTTSLFLQVIIAAAAAGRAAPIAPTSTDLRDLDGFRITTERLVRLGFRSRTAIHPAQVEIINEALSPTEGEIEAARALINTLGSAAVAVDGNGRMIDAAVVRSAHEVIARTQLT